LVGFPIFCILAENILNTSLWFLATIAGKYRALRKVFEPILEIRLFLFIDVPEEWCFGVNPAKAAICLASLNKEKSGVSARTATAVILPTPGMAPSCILNKRVGNYTCKYVFKGFS
jgi:hypothetical protein